MGAEYNFKQLKATTFDEAVMEAEDLIEDALYDHGHAGYTGTWAECCGIEFKDCGVVAPEDIKNWLDDNCEKWGPMIITVCGGHWYAGAICSC